MGRQGLNTADWVGAWVNVLKENGLPGPDYMLFGTNISSSKWACRIAEYDDADRAYRILLQLEPICFSAEEANEFIWHGLRHFQPTCAAQQGLSETRVTELGGWDPKSKMAQRYNSIPGVRELQTRNYIMDAVRGGWQIAEACELPKELPKGVKFQTVPVEPSASTCPGGKTNGFQL